MCPDRGTTLDSKNMKNINSSIDVPKFMEKAKPYRSPIKVEIDAGALFHNINIFLERHYSKIIHGAFIYVLAHIIASLTR